MESLQNKVAVITGGSSGIGCATAHALAQRGARIVIADIDSAGADAVAADITRSGGQAAGVRCDVGAEAAFDELKGFTLDRFGQVDVVMNNVGVLTSGLPDHLPVQEWQRIININLFSVVRSNTAFMPLLIEQGHGHIVNTASFAGLFTYAYDRLPYAASKASIVQISEGLRIYLHPQGVGVTVLCPGPVKTNISVGLPRTFGPEPGIRGPGAQFALLEPDVVGEQVAQAILDDTFMLYTHEQVRDTLVERASDWNAFIAKQTDTIANTPALMQADLLKMAAEAESRD
ncbi:SDR family oxidoreductase [Nocardia sp. CA2R105]|uniref:SDR family oxidoreductase n=1 Tax=Nocardia coffeae TaxID=2873381 RepID=UPI001CA696CE|nr:SDR family oxidoreductase [Nocardia coffeae]MBY8862317.1 SDR family oxidoreductase [Nocardia coffeae]